MQGVNILHQEVVMDEPDWYFKVVGLLLILVIVFIGITAAMANNIDWLCCISAVLGIICLVSLWLLIIIEPQASTGRYRYECTIDKSVSIRDIYDNYDVVEQRGELWILEDKEEK
jgi:hypothetical protein